MLPYKADMRKLKALGLTISLPVGYRLSPLGEMFLRRSSRTLTGPTDVNADA